MKIDRITLSSYDRMIHCQIDSYHEDGNSFIQDKIIAVTLMKSELELKTTNSDT